jgi:hypothetical protein
LTLQSEVAKWDENCNDNNNLPKHMSNIMMDMTDITRRLGPLKTTMDVINAAKKISEAGTKLDKLTREIADQCPESSTKKDLLAYLQRIALYCHPPEDEKSHGVNPVRPPEDHRVDRMQVEVPRKAST